MPNTQERRRKDRPERTRTDPTGAERSRTMAGVSHTNPVTGEPFGESQAYARGRTVVADGGEAEATADDEERDTDEEEVARVKDVDHTPREGAPDASAVYERGGEGGMDETEEEEVDKAGENRDETEAVTATEEDEE